MKAIIITITFALLSSVLHDPDITGTWSGALEVQGTQLNVVFHVKKVNDRYETTMDSPDQNATGLRVTATRFNHPNVRFDISAAGAVYEGVMSDQKITGKWVQSGTALFLVLSKHDEASDRDTEE